MSFPTIPDINPDIDINQADVINLLLASIAFEELGLAHIINSEAEKIQFVLGTLKSPNDEQPTPPANPTIDDLLKINRSVEQTLKSVIKTEILLEFKLEEIQDISSTTSTTTTTTSTTTTTTSTSTSTTTTTTTTTSTTSTTTTTTYDD